MAGLSSLISVALPVFNGVNSYLQQQEATAERQQRLNLLQTQQQQTLAQLQASQQQELDSASAESANQQAQLEASADSDEKSRRAALRAAQASARAKLAARGADPSDGSGQALLDGLQSATDDESADAASATQLKSAALTQQLAAQNQANLLERTQLAERQKLQLLSAYYTY